MSLKPLPAKRDGEFRLAHISDIHIATGKSVLGRRIRSMVRREVHENSLFLKLALENMAAQEVDHLVITGDLTQAAREDEFKQCRELLAPFADGKQLSIVPGNHDISYRRIGGGNRHRSHPAKLRAFLRRFGDLIPAEYPPELKRKKKLLFPYVKFLDDGEIVLLGMDSTTRFSLKTLALNPFGYVNRAQRRELTTLLEHPAIAERVKIILMHHHPLMIPMDVMMENFKQLFQASVMLDLFYRSKVSLVLHGHKHNPFCWKSHNFHEHDLTVLCAAPLSAYMSSRYPHLVYNIYSIRGSRIQVHYKSVPLPADSLRMEFDFPTERIKR